MSSSVLNPNPQCEVYSVDIQKKEEYFENNMFYRMALLDLSIPTVAINITIGGPLQVEYNKEALYIF